MGIAPWKGSCRAQASLSRVTTSGGQTVPAQITTVDAEYAGLPRALPNPIADPLTIPFRRNVDRNIDPLDGLGDISPSRFRFVPAQPPTADRLTWGTKSLPPARASKVSRTVIAIIHTTAMTTTVNNRAPRRSGTRSGQLMPYTSAHDYGLQYTK